VTRERSEGEATETKMEAAARPVRTDARAARGSKTQGSEKSNEQSSGSQIEVTISPSHTKPARRAASSSENVDEKLERKGQRVKKAPAAGLAPKRRGGKRAVPVQRRVPVAAAPRRRTQPTPVPQLMPPPQLADTSPADTILEGAVDSLRRLLSELIEQRMETVVRDLAEVRSEAASASSDGAARVVERLDQMLDSLGAVKFAAPRFDALDPLIHVVLEERHEAGIPDGVILATIRPGFRTGRGLVLCKAAVAVNRGV
jgi:molecular chaperone GrpE (heat shock protein)